MYFCFMLLFVNVWLVMKIDKIENIIVFSYKQLIYDESDNLCLKYEYDLMIEILFY